MKFYYLFPVILNTLVEPFCHRNWDRFGSSCYLFSQDSYDWFKAQISCIAHGSKLAEVESYDELTFLRDHAMRYGGDYWLGGRDDVIEGVWEWQTNNKPFTVTDWAAGEPNNKQNQDCLHIFREKDYHWDDNWCDANLNYICETDYYDSGLIG